GPAHGGGDGMGKRSVTRTRKPDRFIADLDKLAKNPVRALKSVADLSRLLELALVGWHNTGERHRDFRLLKDLIESIAYICDTAWPNAYRAAILRDSHAPVAPTPDGPPRLRVVKTGGA